MKSRGWGDCVPIYGQWVSQGLQPIVVGGQAVNLWAEYFAGRANYFGAVASKDLDVLGNESDAEQCARVLHGATCMRINRMKEAVPMSAIVVVPGDPEDLQIDFQEEVRPIARQEIVERAVSLPTASGMVQVMHPRHCLFSRTYNVTSVWLKGKKKYDNPIGLRQLTTAMTVFRLFMRELLESSPTGPMQVCRNQEELFRFLQQDEGLRLWETKKIDLFVCIEPLIGLPDGYLNRRYRRMHDLMSERHPSPRMI